MRRPSPMRCAAGRARAARGRSVCGVARATCHLYIFVRTPREIAQHRRRQRLEQAVPPAVASLFRRPQPCRLPCRAPAASAWRHRARRWPPAGAFAPGFPRAQASNARRACATRCSARIAARARAAQPARVDELPACAHALTRYPPPPVVSPAAAALRRARAPWWCAPVAAPPPHARRSAAPQLRLRPSRGLAAGAALRSRRHCPKALRYPRYRAPLTAAPRRAGARRGRGLRSGQDV